MSYSEFLSATSPLVGLRDSRDSALTVFGVPFDGTSSFRPGAREGPNAIREAFLNIEAYSKVLDVDVEQLTLRDLGNLTKCIDSEKTSQTVAKLARELLDGGQRYCMLGGEHSITLGSYQSAPKDSGLVVFDAHFDLRDEWEGSAYSHACYLRRVIEERDRRLVAHIGGRAGTKEEWSLSRELGLVIPPEKAESEASVRLFQKFIKKLPKAYVTIDIDALDPAYAPGTGTPEPGGISTSTLLRYIYALKGTSVTSFDIVEVCPPYDNGATTTVAARFMNELIALCSLQK